MAQVASRRGFLAALAAFTGSTTAGTAALATASPAAEPDPELIAAEARWKQALAFLNEAEDRHGAAADRIGAKFKFVSLS